MDIGFVALVPGMLKAAPEPANLLVLGSVLTVLGTLWRRYRHD